MRQTDRQRQRDRETGREKIAEPSREVLSTRSKPNKTSNK